MEIGRERERKKRELRKREKKRELEIGREKDRVEKGVKETVRKSMDTKQTHYTIHRHMSVCRQQYTPNEKKCGQFYRQIWTKVDKCGQMWTNVDKCG